MPCCYTNYDGLLKAAVADLCRARGLAVDGEKTKLLARLTVHEMELSEMTGVEAIVRIGAQLWCMTNSTLQDMATDLGLLPKRYKACLVPQILTHRFATEIQDYRALTSAASRPTNTIAEITLQTMTDYRSFSPDRLATEYARLQNEINSPHGTMTPAGIQGFQHLCTFITGLRTELLRTGTEYRDFYGTDAPTAHTQQFNSSPRARGHETGPVDYPHEIYASPPFVSELATSQSQAEQRGHQPMVYNGSPRPSHNGMQPHTPEGLTRQVARRSVSPPFSISSASSLRATHSVTHTGRPASTRVSPPAPSGTSSRRSGLNADSLAGVFDRLVVQGGPIELPAPPYDPPSRASSAARVDGFRARSDSGHTLARNSSTPSRSVTSSVSRHSSLYDRVTTPQHVLFESIPYIAMIRQMPRDITKVAYQLHFFDAAYPKIGRFSKAFNDSVVIKEDIANILRQFPPTDADVDFPSSWVNHPPLATGVLQQLRKDLAKLKKDAGLEV